MATQLERLYGISCTALQARQIELDLLADNLANINTPGFKERRLSFAALLETATDGSLAHGGVALNLAGPDFREGPIESTGQTWHLAIDGEGFFRVQLPNGQIGYTRLGDFRLDAGGRVVNAQGAILLPPLVIPQGAEDVLIDAQGVVTVMEGSTPRQLGRIELARFPNPEGLISAGDGVYLASEAAGTPIVGQPAQGGLGQILARALEMSNVDPTRQMVNMIRVQRSYALALKALQISDQMASLTNQLIA